MRKIILLLMCFSLVGTSYACTGSANNDEAITELNEQLSDAKTTIDEQSQQLKELTSNYTELREQLDGLSRGEAVNAQSGSDKPYVLGDETSAVSTSSSDTEAVDITETVPLTDSAVPSGDIVYVTESGSKYHSVSTCSNMKTPLELALTDAETQGYSPCTKCY